MAQRLMFGVPELSSIFYFVVFLPSGQVSFSYILDLDVKQENIRYGVLYLVLYFLFLQH